MLKKYIKKLSEYPRLRVLLIIIVVIVVIVVLFDLFSPSSSSNNQAAVPGSDIQNVNTGTHTTKIGAQKYQQEQQQREHEAYENKIKSGSDVFKGLFDKTTKVTTAPSREVKQPAQTSAPKQTATKQTQQPVPTTTSVSPTQYFQGEQQAQQQAATPTYTTASTPQDEATLKALEQKYKSAIQSKASAWSQMPSMTHQGNFAPPKLVNGTTNDKMPLTNADIMIKAGTILFAVIENTVDSDQANTPVLALVAAGKYRGARLMGTFSREKDKLVIRFTQLITDNSPGAIGINAYAINPETAENALATSVNHHYLERYGSLFAASLLQGFGNAFSNYQNPCYGTNNCFVSGNVERPSVTTTTALYQGLGQIGNNVSGQVRNNFNLPVTVKVKRGTGVGILFMSDVTDRETPNTNSASAAIGNLNTLNQAAKNQLSTGSGQSNSQSSNMSTQNASAQQNSNQPYTNNQAVQNNSSVPAPQTPPIPPGSQQVATQGNSQQQNQPVQPQF